MKSDYLDRSSYYDNLPWSKKLERPRDRQIIFGPVAKRRTPKQNRQRGRRR